MNSVRTLIAAIVLSFIAAMAQAQVIGIATLSPGSSFYAIGTAISAVMQQKAHLTTRVQPMSGPAVYIPLINRDEVEFGIATSLEALNAYSGLATYSGHKNPNLRNAGVMLVVPIGIAVANDSPIRSVKDLKGKRMPTQFTAQGTIHLLQDAMLATAGLSTSDMKPYPVANYLKGMKALGEGKVDAAMFCIGCAVASEVNVALASHGGLRFLPLSGTPAAMAGMHKFYPGAYLKIFRPSPAFPGVRALTPLMAFSGYLLTNNKVSDEVVYKAVKALYHNKSMLAASTHFLKTFNPRAMTEKSVVPYQAGAVKFYRQVGEWPPKQRH